LQQFNCNIDKQPENLLLAAATVNQQVAASIHAIQAVVASNPGNSSCCCHLNSCHMTAVFCCCHMAPLLQRGQRRQQLSRVKSNAGDAAWHCLLLLFSDHTQLHTNCNTH
jgi:hypothetical protein